MNLLNTLLSVIIAEHQASSYAAGRLDHEGVLGPGAGYNVIEEAAAIDGWGLSGGHFSSSPSRSSSRASALLPGIYAIVLAWSNYLYQKKRCCCSPSHWTLSMRAVYR